MSRVYIFNGREMLLQNVHRTITFTLNQHKFCQKQGGTGPPRPPNPVLFLQIDPGNGDLPIVEPPKSVCVPGTG